MSRLEIQKLLQDAIDKINILEDDYRSEIKLLKDRIGFLEEMHTSQKNMLKDAVEHITKIENKNSPR